MSTTTSVTSERQIRRDAAKKGYRVWKVRFGSRWFSEYGPFSLLDSASNAIMQSGCSLDEIRHFIAAEAA